MTYINGIVNGILFIIGLIAIGLVYVLIDKIYDYLSR